LIRATANCIRSPFEPAALPAAVEFVAAQFTAGAEPSTYLCDSPSLTEDDVVDVLNQKNFEEQ